MPVLIDRVQKLAGHAAQRFKHYRVGMTLVYARRKFWRLAGEPDDIQFQRHITDAAGNLVGYVSRTGRSIFYGADWCRSRGEPINVSVLSAPPSPVDTCTRNSSH